MGIKKGGLYSKIFKQGLIYESDIDELSQSLMELFEKEILRKEEQLNQLTLEKELLKKGISSSKEEN